MPGPAPKPAGERRRRNAPLANNTQLPAGGRVGDAPTWPLECDEPPVWVELWATPQSAAWERLGWTRVVARYALLLPQAEVAGCSAAILTATQQIEDRLGLSPMAMLRLRWEVAADEVLEQRAVPVAPRGRLRVVAEEFQQQVQ